MTGFDAKIRREQPDGYQINFYTDNEVYFDMVQHMCRLCVSFANEANRLRKAQRETQQLKWISVKDRMPPADGHDILFRTDDNRVIAGFRTPQDRWAVSGHFYHSPYLYRNDQVTHWMPMPDVLKKVTGEL